MTTKPQLVKRSISIIDGYCQLVARYTHNTARRYNAVWKQWSDYLTENGVALEDATERDALGFVTACYALPGVPARADPSDNKASRATVHNKAVILRGIYRDLVDYGYTSRNPFIVAVPRETERTGVKRPTQAVPRGQVKGILELKDAHTHEGKRDRAFLALLFGCGLRIQEALNLKIDDCQEEHLALRRTKGAEYETQVLPAWVSTKITDFKLCRLKEGAKSCDSFLVEYYADGRPRAHGISQSTGRRLFKRLMADAGLPPGITPHSARATAITKLLEMGLDYREVQEFSRHSSVKMVEQYDKRRFDKKNSPNKKLKY